MPDLRIMIVDDSISACRFMTKLLRPLNGEVFQAANGQEGLVLSEEMPMDLIITDIDMPEMNGIEFCQRLKDNPKTRKTPVIMLSAYDSSDYVRRGFQAGAAAYISKKETKESLYKTVQEILDKSQFQREQLVLVVDDSRAIQESVRTGLEKAGFQVLTAENGKVALDLVARQKPDLILSDINMPVMDGFAFCEAIRSDPNLGLIPFVVMSTNNKRADIKQMIQYGATTYMVKPFIIDQLVVLVEKLLSDQFLFIVKEKERLDTERSMMLASITSLCSALEARDAYTQGHSESVARIVTGMVSLTGVGKKELEKVSIGCKLHDIGKIGVRDDVLLKPGPLTDSEFDHIKRHPVIGASILKAIPSFSDIISIVLNHHERFDGSGYPQGLKGDQISQWARMTAVADTYDALTSNRPYRKGLPTEKALQIIKDVRGSQLCPNSVDLFFKWIEETEDNA